MYKFFGLFSNLYNHSLYLPQKSSEFILKFSTFTVPDSTFYVRYPNSRLFFTVLFLMIWTYLLMSLKCFTPCLFPTFFLWYRSHLRPCWSLPGHMYINFRILLSSLSLFNKLLFKGLNNTYFLVSRFFESLGFEFTRLYFFSSGSV